jgi:membrane-associated phospholipid phosphatase
MRQRPDRQEGRLQTSSRGWQRQDYGWLVLWLTVLVLSIGLALLIDRDGPIYGEAEILEEVQGWAFPGMTLSRAVSFITATERVIPIGAVLAVVLWFRGDRRYAITLVVLLIALPLAQYGIKELIDRARPAENGIEVRASVRSPSFPSGHVMSATVLYGWLLAYGAFAAPLHRLLSLLLRASCVVLLLLAGLVSVYLGVHWPTDVFGGHGWGFVLLLPALVAGGLWFPRRVPDGLHT